MCEQAGTGLRMMQREWQALGHAPPINTNDRVHKSFATFLPEPRGAAVPQPTAEVTGEVTGEVARLIGVMTGELSRQELQRALGLKHEDHFREAYLKPALALVEMTRPDKPKSRLQRYRLTEMGRRLKGGRAS